VAVNQNFYDLNTARGYPLDDIATAISDAGVKMPDGILVDCCFRFPAGLGQYAFISAVHVSPVFVSCVISVASDLASVSFLPVAALSVAGTVSEGAPYELTPLVSGVGGWVVFGDTRSLAYSGRFSTAAQGLLLPRVARSYHPRPVSSLARENVTTVLVGDVNLVAGRELEIIRARRFIDGADRDAIVIRLTGQLSKILPKYAGLCGGRPESGTCNSDPITRVGDAFPDDSGNVVLDFGDMDVAAIPNGLLIGTDITLRDICGSQLTLPISGEDACGSLSVISEIAVSTSVTDSHSVGGDGGIDNPPSIITHFPVFPLPIRFFDDPFVTTQQVATLPIFGTWGYTTDVPPVIPSSSFGYREPRWRSLVLTAMGLGESGLPGPGGAVALFSPGYEAFGYGVYSDIEEVKLECAVMLGSSDSAGILLNWSGTDAPSLKKFQSRTSSFTTLRLNQVSKTLEIVRFNGVAFETPMAQMPLPDLQPDRWYRIILWITDAPSQPGKSDFRGFITDLTGVTSKSIPPRYWFQVVSQPSPDPGCGPFGVSATSAGAKFGYLVLDSF
jgi:hypothetical protein